MVNHGPKQWAYTQGPRRWRGKKTLGAANLGTQDSTKKPDARRDPGSTKTFSRGPKPQRSLCQAVGRNPNHWLRDCAIVIMSHKQQLKPLSYCLTCLRMKPKSPIGHNSHVYLQSVAAVTPSFCPQCNCSTKLVFSSLRIQGQRDTDNLFGNSVTDHQHTSINYSTKGGTFHPPETFEASFHRWPCISPTWFPQESPQKILLPHSLQII